jgi:CheY-like chemotaxis protein
MATTDVVLVVDDSMLIRHTIRRYLEERGFRVESAANGREALEVLTRGLPTLIVTDLQMPQMTGSELITELKARPETAAIPIVVVAARSSMRDGQAETRAQFVICKDIDIDEQLDRALSVLYDNHLSGSCSASATSLRKAAARAPSTTR